MQFFTTILAALALAVSTTTATPIDARAKLIVVTPEITKPVAGDLWTVGTQQLVQWDTSDIPDEAKNYTGSIVLGYSDGVTDSENLDFAHPLAKGFLLTAGSQSVTVPDVVNRTTYFVVLMGDSGNRSPYFTIEPAYTY